MRPGLIPAAALLALGRYGLGGRQGNGRQFVSWIHDQDYVRAIQWLIDHDDLHGPVILAAPHPLGADGPGQRLG